jgi:hypothetical protein
MWTKEGINNDNSNNQGKHEHGVRTDKEVGGKDWKTLLSDKAIFLSANEKNSSLLSAGRHN